MYSTLDIWNLTVLKYFLAYYMLKCREKLSNFCQITVWTTFLDQKILYPPLTWSTVLKESYWSDLREKTEILRQTTVPFKWTDNIWLFE